MTSVLAAVARQRTLSHKRVNKAEPARRWKVDVTVGSSISVNPPTVTLQKNQDRAKWVNDNGTQFAIVLPAGYDTPTCGPEGNKYACTSKTFGTVGTIKYTVTSPGKKDLDPDIDVVP